VACGGRGTEPQRAITPTFNEKARSSSHNERECSVKAARHVEQGGKWRVVLLLWRCVVYRGWYPGWAGGGGRACGAAGSCETRPAA